MESPIFNPEVFLNVQHTEANSTELLPVPDGDYTGISDPVTDKSFITYDITSGDRAGQKGVMLIVQWNLNDEGDVIKNQIGRKPTVRQSFMLDLTPSGGLDFGKGRNVELGKLREALGQNGTGQPWAFSMLGSQVAKLSVKSTISKKDGKLYTNVNKVAKV